MLVLTRKTEQAIMIGDDVEIRVLRVKPNGDVLIGIKAPQKYRVDRGEVYLARKAEREAKQRKE